MMITVFAVFYLSGIVFALVAAGFDRRDGQHKDMITMLIIAALFASLLLKELGL